MVKCEAWLKCALAFLNPEASLLWLVVPSPSRPLVPPQPCPGPIISGIVAGWRELRETSRSPHQETDKTDRQGTTIALSPIALSSHHHRPLTHHPAVPPHPPVHSITQSTLPHVTCGWILITTSYHTFTPTLSSSRDLLPPSFYSPPSASISLKSPPLFPEFSPPPYPSPRFPRSAPLISLFSAVHSRIEKTKSKLGPLSLIFHPSIHPSASRYLYTTFYLCPPSDPRCLVFFGITSIRSVLRLH